MPRIDQSTAISFTVGVGILPDPEVTTRGALTDASAGSGYYFNDGDRVRIAVKGSAPRSTSWEYKTYKVDTGDGGSAKANPNFTSLTLDTSISSLPFNWYSTTETGVKFRAWSYGNSTDPSDDPLSTDFALVTNQSGGYKELLYMDEVTKSYTASAIQMSMNHELARVVVNLSLDASQTVTSVTIGDGTMVIPTTARFDPNETLHWKSHVSATSQITPFEHTAGSKYSAVLLPYTYAAGGKLFNIVIGSVSYNYIIPAGGFTFNPAKQYTFNITIKNNLVFCNSVTVEAWDTSAAAIPVVL